MIRYSRWSPPERADEVEAHVRAHLSAVADPDDNPDTYADRVKITREDRDGGVYILGELDAEPDAPYLSSGFDPQDEARANPLVVRSIEDES